MNFGDSNGTVSGTGIWEEIIVYKYRTLLHSALPQLVGSQADWSIRNWLGMFPGECCVVLFGGRVKYYQTV